MTNGGKRKQKGNNPAPLRTSFLGRVIDLELLIINDFPWIYLYKKKRQSVDSMNEQESR